MYRWVREGLLSFVPILVQLSSGTRGKFPPFEWRRLALRQNFSGASVGLGANQRLLLTELLEEAWEPSGTFPGRTHVSDGWYQGPCQPLGPIPSKPRPAPGWT